MLDMEQWAGFEGRIWREEVNVRDFIQKNYKPYDGDESFLAEPTDATNKLWGALQKLQKEEREKGGVLDCETEVVSGLTAYGPGYIDESMKDLEQVVGLQTDKPLKRAFMPYGGIRMAEQAAESYGYEINPELKYVFENYMTTHNDAVFAAYTNEMKLARKTHVVTGLPDTYGRGRIVGDYRRVALYGIDYLIAQKEADKANCGCGNMYDDVIRLREEIAMQITALKGMKEMAKSYGYDISLPAKNAKEACQWLYFGYLAAIKTQNGAAMSVGRVSTFLDIYFERDLANGVLTESEAQEIIDHMTMKFRMVKFARIPSYNQLFSGDPTWATLEVGGIGMDGRSMVTKTDYRFLHTLENMGPSPEPNLTVLYSSRLPENFKKFAALISVETSSIQYENDDVMRPVWGDDYSICCCVSATETGKEMQFFGARANLAKCLLYAINGGVDEKTKQQVGPSYQPITSEYLDYDEVIAKYDKMMDWLAHLYVGTLNMIHYMHDKYYYEAAEMALIDTKVERSFATGIAGFSHVVDSLSAIKYAKVKAIRDEDGITTDFVVEGDFPRYGNDDDRADEIATTLLSTFLEKLKHIHTYRDSKPTTSILTITSNVVYGKATGSLPDGRKAGEPLAPGANPSYGAEQNGLLASLNSVAKLDYEDALDTYTALIKYDKKNANAYFLRGSVYLNTNQGKKALKDYEKAVEVDSGNYEMYEGIYQNLKNSGQEEEAVKYLEKALDIKPKEGADYAQRGHIYYLMEDYDNAKKNLDKAIDKNDKTALLYLAEVYNALGQVENAQALLENYVKDNAGDSEALNTLGMMQLNDGNYEDALKYFELGLKVKNAPNRQELLKNQIAAYEYMGDFESAKEKMKSYLKEYPNDESALREETFLKTR